MATNSNSPRSPTSPTTTTTSKVLHLTLFGHSIHLGSSSVVFLVLGHAFTSSTLSIVNKYALVKFGYPSFLTAIQYATSAAAVWILGRLNYLEHDPLVLKTVWAYTPAAITFYVAIWTNANLLQSANVDTFIVFRSTTPILVAVADSVFRDQPWPSSKTWSSLCLILLGALGYVLTDSHFTLRTFTWAAAYLITITFEMVYVKHIVHDLGLNSWGFVYYNNIMSLVMSPFFWYFTGEYRTVLNPIPGAGGETALETALFPVALSCVLGLGISFFSFAARKAISATSFTVLGLVSKLGTVVINVLIWSRHASPFGLVCLLLTIFGGVVYQQAAVSDTISAEAVSAAGSGVELTGADEDFEKGREGETSGEKEEESLLPQTKGPKSDSPFVIM